MTKLDEKTLTLLKGADMLKGKFDDYIRIAQTFQSEVSKGNNTTQAVTNTSITCCVAEVTVYRAVREVKDLI